MSVRIHPHAMARIAERGATTEEVRATVEGGEQFPAKFNRVGFRRNFPFASAWRQKVYATKQFEAYAVQEGSDWVVITVIVKYFWVFRISRGSVYMLVSGHAGKRHM
jgi:hypothetical protein